MFASVWKLLSFAIGAASLRRQTLQPVHLAVQPNCGSLSGPPADVNGGLQPLGSYKSIVSFGDSYTSGGTINGSKLPPPILSPPNPNAGGRISNGPLWIENLASSAGAELHDWAANGSVVDSSIYLNRTFDAPDFMTQVNNYIDTRLASAETLYVIFMGIGDYELRNEVQTVSLILASDIIWAMLELSSSPIFGTDFLVVDNYGRGTQSAVGDAYKTSLFSQLNSLNGMGLNIGFVDFKTLWDGVLHSNPGYQAFGYISAGSCLLSDLTMSQACNDPDHTFYWIPGHPSAATHTIMADYVKEVLTQCTARK
ncbi:hypothetical protein D9757_008792 [Collybiopsis confluens]|uniref:Uncharacterized protein n=1 Tax=Collybiopsis confluens TaxID=2823264 RepID=A0A8H5H546_9AGAR|nr:hypothetical protein D9757_008792 [Collybiopsis confluens]